MTDYKTLSDSELTEALNFHRRQRNMSRGINEAAHMRQIQVVRLLEAEESRRLNEEKPNKYVIYKHQKDKYGVSQDIGTGYNWDHSYHHGYHDTVDAAKAWAMKHAGKYPHKIEVKEEVELEEAEVNYVIKHKKTKEVLNTHSDYATAKDEHEGLGADKNEYGVYKQTKKDAALRNRTTYREEAEQLDEIGDTTKGRKALKAVIARAPEKAANARLKSDVLGRRQFDPDVSSADSERYGHAADKHYRKYQLAVKGAARAVDRLTKEEAELDEASLLGPQGAIHKQASADQSDREYIKQMTFKNAWKKKNPGKKWPGYEKAGFKEEVELDEQGIKGWKNAASDISKMRAAQGKDVKLVSLKKDGTESKMNDASKMFRSEDEAQEHHDRVTKLNPKSKIRHNLYVDGKHVKTLGEEVELDEAESWEAGYNRRVVKTTSAEHKEKGYNWRIKGKERPEISIKLYKAKPSQEEFNKQMRRVAGHEFGG